MDERNNSENGKNIESEGKEEKKEREEDVLCAVCQRMVKRRS